MSGGVTSDNVTEPVDDASDGGNLGRAAFVLPEPADDCADAKDEYREREGKLNGSFGPVSGTDDGLLKYAPAINCAEANLHKDGGGRNDPAIAKFFRCHFKFPCR